MSAPTDPSATPAADHVVLRPDRRRAGLWWLVGLASLWLSAWVATQGDVPAPLGIGLLVGAVALTGLVGLQVVAPRAWTMDVTPRGVHGRMAGLRVDADFADHTAVEVTRRFGEPRLVLRGQPRIILVLPIGADEVGLRDLLGRRGPSGPAGRADQPPPTP